MNQGTFLPSYMFCLLELALHGLVKTPNPTHVGMALIRTSDHTKCWEPRIIELVMRSAVQNSCVIHSRTFSGTFSLSKGAPGKAFSKHQYGSNMFKTHAERLS